MKRVLLSVVIGLLLFNSSVVCQSGPGWIQIDSDDMTFYYNLNDIIKTKRNTIKVWLKVVLKSKKFKDDYEKGRKNDWPKHHLNYSFTLALQEYDCEGMVRYLEVIDYDEEGKAIAEDKPNDLASIGWRHILPEKTEYIIAKRICSLLEKDN